MNIRVKSYAYLAALTVVSIILGCAAPTQTPVIGQQEQEQGTDVQAASYDNAAMLDPTKATEKAPDKYKAKFVTTKGDIVLEINRAWSPTGADRFYNMVKIGYFKDTVFFRAVKGFMVQFGIHGDPAVNKKWSEAKILDDPNAAISNTKGKITFAKTGRPNSRSVQFFINLGDNGGLDRQGFTPFGEVIEGMDVVEKINTEYGENQNEDQPRFQGEGNKFILGKYPNLDIIKSVEIVGQ